VTFTHLVAALFEAGVTYWQRPDGTLGYRAPAGAVTPALRMAMAAHKADLCFLSSGGVMIYGRGQEPAACSGMRSSN
jgi:hypothetical protein